MHPRLAELVDYITAQRSTLLAAVSAVPEHLREQQVSPDAWSAAQNLEHLHRVEKGIARLLGRTLEHALAAGVPRETEGASVLSSLDALRLTDRGLRIDAPGPVQPRGVYTAAQSLRALTQSREDLLEALAPGDGLALGKIVRPHPLLGSLNLYQWVLFVGQHEGRHAAQIQDLARDLAQCT